MIDIAIFIISQQNVANATMQHVGRPKLCYSAGFTWPFGAVAILLVVGMAYSQAIIEKHPAA
ncbi:hypothetical protein [Lacticaseibacillus saniviri]|uniref:Uncharacterized protein n=1 Tax=Lacticaseibacillus saniviri JCM 17471 = DSM 24301 TaxID=1293598 RepID=A0A0R2MN80_9LACO|nr:hypothetical protein [Lacticaseibacillus saniviri]KRO15143.1 hypothetical protein IV56_GL000233 [Lacticaseibacillus saniviri JCM 17471 = DSM 24301]